MSKKYPSNELPHLWAHQSVEGGDSSSAMSFQGRTFFSYSTPIATIATGALGEAYLITESGSYSMTTSTHQNMVKAAIPYGAKVFTVPAVSRHGNDKMDDTTRVMDRWRKQVGYLVEDAAKRPTTRGKATKLLEMAKLIVTMREFVAWFGLTGSDAVIPEIPLFVDDIDRVIAGHQAEQEKLVKLRAKEQAKRDTVTRRANAKKLKAWLCGKLNYAYFPTVVGTHLRVVGDEVETTAGVKFPVSHAKRALTLIERVMTQGKEWHSNGHTCKLGHYQIDSITPDGTVHAGCHVVEWKAIERIAEQVRTAPTKKEAA